MSPEDNPLWATSVVEDVIEQYGENLSNVDLYAARKAEEASLRRNEAGRWLRKIVGVVASKDLPAEPSEEEFRNGLRSGIILCNALNKVQPGSVQKVIEAPLDSASNSDGAALSAYQYFENVRNFLVAMEEMGLPTFQASDLAHGGKPYRVVNCVLALKSYWEWKQGGIGSWKLSGNLKPTSCGKQFLLKNSQPFMNSISHSSSVIEKALNNVNLECDHPETEQLGSLQILVNKVLADKKPEDIPLIVGNLLGKIMEEFEHRLSSHNEEQVETSTQDISLTSSSSVECSYIDSKDEDKANPAPFGEEQFHHRGVNNITPRRCDEKQHMLIKQQQNIQDLKCTLCDTKKELRCIQVKYNDEVNNLGKHLQGLAHAASGYQKVLEENRKLYNQVQDLKGSIRVYCRVRPFLPGQQNRFSTLDHVEEGSITIITPSKYGKEGKKTFTFNRCFGPSATQEQVFTDTQPLIRSVLDGYNVCIFAYGQTGSGKTYTMSGPDEVTKETQGVNYRALDDLFLISEQRKNTIAYEVSVQMIEIYNEQVRDLLATDGIIKKLEIRNNSQKGLNVPDANIVSVSSTSEVLKLMNLGQKNRAVGATAMNTRSSRSHSCLTVHVQGRGLTSGTILRGCLHMVDLAGSERADKTEATGERLKEAQHINKSLSALGDVIYALGHKSSHVPYRNSKLTQLLQDSLGGQAKTLMFVHISPEADAIGETLSTLKFAERVSAVELGAARANKDSPDVKELKEQIANLKAALAKKEGISSRSSSPDRKMTSSGSSPSNYSLQSFRDMQISNQGQLIEDVDDNIEVRKSSEAIGGRQILDLDDLHMNSPPWQPSTRPGSNEYEKDAMTGEWVDKVIVNKKNSINRGYSLGRLDECYKQHSTEMLFEKFSPDDCVKVRPAQQNFVAVDDPDFDANISVCSSEHDFVFQMSTSNVSGGIKNGMTSKLRRPSPKRIKSPETRSSIPPPSRRLSTGMLLHSSTYKTRIQTPNTNAKRRASSGK
ncbi:unnamed protein product [Cuscuta epithymum]|uniref:Uncharacterized protein n=2 Tax=Cuscuta epithymum TaxID=186058 RepID=A0AAV0FZI5_9ASTE|nr:unnamed protein product [Cuscuta epithymum]